MADFFRAYKAQATHVPTFFIESTAPNNVDDEIPSNASPVPPELIQVDADAAIGEIAEALSTGADPNLVVMVHGFNNTRDRVLDMYRDAAVAIQQDAEIQAHRSGLVCIGYRWPSERMLQPWKDFWRALPRLPAGLFAVGLAMLIVAWILYAERGEWVAWLAHVLALTGIALAGLIAVAFLLRVIVYFRDQYRATNYGIPDLTHDRRRGSGAPCAEADAAATRSSLVHRSQHGRLRRNEHDPCARRRDGRIIAVDRDVRPPVVREANPRTRERGRIPAESRRQDVPADALRACLP